MPSILTPSPAGSHQQEYARRVSDDAIDFSTQRHIDRAAFHVYESLRPEGGLAFDELTSEQRNAIRLRILDARDATDLTKARGDVLTDPRRI